MFVILLPLFWAWPGIVAIWLAETPHPLSGLPLLPVLVAGAVVLAFEAYVARRWLRQRRQGRVLLRGGTGHGN